MLSWMLQCIHGERTVMWPNNESGYDPVESHLCLGRKTSVFVESDQLQLCHQKPPGITLLTLWASHASANSHHLRQTDQGQTGFTAVGACIFFLLIFFLLIYIKLDNRAIKCVSALFHSRIRSFSNIFGNTSRPAGCTIYVLVLFPREPRDFTTERFSS